MAIDQAPDGLDEVLRLDALEVLRDALQWRLTGSRWAAVVTMRSALGAGDIEALRGAVYKLELAGPIRVASFGDVPITEPPEPGPRADHEADPHAGYPRRRGVAR